ncbi:MAG: YebC/PmpR family DNA-binding transcriptional regulator [Rhodospirillales bacterium]|nr:YebC/PmpR family DNA-binding transcriptional regulator [Rhodospirillales bacterium]MCB9995728.1 YebC/PmpR family DNA-binding transcriptional regulator [Rhodospirillales bacterium]
MAGHSKWANIKHKKGKADAARAKVFSKLAREITVAAKIGGGDPDMNPRLRLAVATARGQSMPKANIETAIQKGVGGGEGDDYVEMRYEGYGPGGVAIIVDTLTDNKNRTAGEVRSYFAKYGGNLGETGSVNFMFDRVGEIFYPLDKADGESMFEAAVEAGANDCATDEDGHTITTEPDDLAAVRDTLEAKLGEPERSGLIWQPNTMAEVNEDQATTLMKLIDVLEDNDDVQNVTTNFEVSDEIMEKLLAAG